MERKQFPAVTLKTDEAQGIVEAIVAVMGNVDEGDDRIWPGAFRKTLSERGGKVRVLDSHNAGSVLNVLGKPLAIREVGRDELLADMLAKCPDATGGLWTKTQYNLKTQAGHDAFQHILAGDVDEYSFAYDPIRDSTDYSKVGDRTIRNLRELKLYEYSPTIFGMNPATATLSAKAVTGAAGLPLAPRGRAWDASAAEGRVRTWAEATDAPNAKYASAFFWHDSENADQYTAYKLQFADVLDGELKAVPRGLFAVAGVLSGARGGADIPETDQAAIKRKVSAYYQRMADEFEDDSIIVPWEKSAKAVNLTEYISTVESAFRSQYNPPNGPWNYWTREVYDAYLVACYDGGSGMEMYQVVYTLADDGSVTFAPRGEWIAGDYVFVPRMGEGAKAMDEAEMGKMKRMRQMMQSMLDMMDGMMGGASDDGKTAKAGRVLAARNAERIMNAMRLMQEALADAGLMDMPEDENDSGKSDKAGPVTPPTERMLRLIELEQESLKLLEV